MKHHENESTLGGGADGTVIKDTIESATTVQELTEILEEINGSSGSVFTKIIEQYKNVYGANVSSETKGEIPNITRGVDKLF